jgi:hypothetical protein
LNALTRLRRAVRRAACRLKGHRLQRRWEGIEPWVFGAWDECLRCGYRWPEERPRHDFRSDYLPVPNPNRRKGDR